MVRRGIEKRAPKHKQMNSVADALLIEQYPSAVAAGDLAIDSYVFLTSNHEDSPRSALIGDGRTGTSPTRPRGVRTRGGRDWARRVVGGEAMPGCGPGRVGGVTGPRSASRRSQASAVLKQVRLMRATFTAFCGISRS